MGFCLQALPVQGAAVGRSDHMPFQRLDATTPEYLSANHLLTGSSHRLLWV